MHTRSKNPNSKTSKKSFKDSDFYYDDDNIVDAVRNSIQNEEKLKKKEQGANDSSKTPASGVDANGAVQSDDDGVEDRSHNSEVADVKTHESESDNEDEDNSEDEEKDEIDDKDNSDDEDEELIQKRHNELTEKKMKEVVDNITNNQDQNNEEPTITITTLKPSNNKTDKDEMNTTTYTIPQLAFGLYKVPSSLAGELCILQAIEAGYRHFDTASYYGNEDVLGRALKRSGLPREEFCIASKVWNDALISKEEGPPQAVIQSVHESLQRLDFGTYFDIFLIHWPIPGYFVQAYKQLETLHKEGKIRMLGLSNFNPAEYEELVDANIRIPPVINQFEISAIMYRPKMIEYFQKHNVVVSSSKSLSRGEAFQNDNVQTIAEFHSVTPAQVLLRWLFQQQQQQQLDLGPPEERQAQNQQPQPDEKEDDIRKICIVAKTATPERMYVNRDIFNFTLTKEEMGLLNGLTTEEEIRARENLELYRKISILTTPQN